ncbi:MAG: peptide chain release factor-like protein [Patescibacteria group bacterium]
MNNSDGGLDNNVPLKHRQRARKLRRRRFPRERDYVGKQIKKIEKEKGEKERIEKAEEEIKKQLKNFPKDDEKQIKIYSRWVGDSLEEGYPILDEGDIETKTAVASVKAGGQQRQKSKTSVRITHLPTLIAVRNEEERRLEQNKIKAQENLYYLLVDHLKYWKVLTEDNERPNIESVVRKIIEDLK